MLSATEYQLLVEQAPIMIWRANPSTECDYFNERWLAFRGRSMAEEIGNQWAEGVHPDDLQECLKTYLSSFAKHAIFEMHYRLKRHDGQYRWIFDRGVPFYAPAGEFLGYIGSCIDVTERIEAQQAADAAMQRELENLRGLLRICAICKKIRNADGSWDSLESFISSHSNAEFTHAMCPECVESHIMCAGN